MPLTRSTFILQTIRLALLAAVGAGAVTQQWSLAFVAGAALGLTFLAGRLAQGVGVSLPPSFLAAIAVFVFATVFLGEALSFYGRYRWWDLALHFGSAMGFGVIGFLAILMLFHGDRFAAPPAALAALSFCTAVTVGAIWEIFEFGMDQIFGLNMQKSGLPDTMWDVIVNALGAAIAGVAAYLYLVGQRLPVIGHAFDLFVAANRRLFRPQRKR